MSEGKIYIRREPVLDTSYDIMLSRKKAQNDFVNIKTFESDMPKEVITVSISLPSYVACFLSKDYTKISDNNIFKKNFLYVNRKEIKTQLMKNIDTLVDKMIDEELSDGVKLNG